MSIARTILIPAAQLAGRSASKQLKQFCHAHDDTSGVQDRLLADMVALHANSDFGREHNLSAVRTYEDFTSAVPVGSYETLRPYMQRVFDGETTALLPPDEKVLMFAITSGTTGLPKHIPVTQRSLEALRRTWNLWGVKVFKDHRDAWLRPMLRITSPMREYDSPTGLPCGATSGMLASMQKKIVRKMYVAPPAVCSMKDPAARLYTILRCGLPRDVAMITTANPASIIRLIEIGQQHAAQLIKDVRDGSVTPPGELPADVAACLRFKPNAKLAAKLEAGINRDGKLLPRHFWSVASINNWTGGTLKLYLQRLRELFDNPPIRDLGLVASEGRFSVPLTGETSSGIAEITANFLEFIPVDDAHLDNPPTLRAHQLETGGEYFLVVTNWAGLWRYNMDDRVRVTGWFGQSPMFEFLSRGRSTANMTGEKITEHQVVEAMNIARAATGATVERFVVQGRFAQPPRYQLRIELPTDQATRLAEQMDQALRSLNVEYNSKRKSGLLGAVQAIVLEDGTLERAELEIIQSRRGRSEQYKHQYLLSEVLCDTPTDK